MVFFQRLVPSMDFDSAIERWLDSILAAGPVVIRSQNALLRQWVQLHLESAHEVSNDFFAHAYRADEPRHGKRGFSMRNSREAQRGNRWPSDERLAFTM